MAPRELENENAMGLCQSVTSEAYVERRPELRAEFAAFLEACCTVGAGRFAPRHVLEAAFARHLEPRISPRCEYLLWAAAALDGLCQERGFVHSGWLGNPIRTYYGVNVVYDVDTRVTAGLSVDRFPTKSVIEKI